MLSRPSIGACKLSQQYVRCKKVSVTERIFVNQKVVNIETQTAKSVVKSLNKTWKDLYGPRIFEPRKYHEPEDSRRLPYPPKPRKLKTLASLDLQPVIRPEIRVLETGFKSLPSSIGFPDNITEIVDPAEHVSLDSRRKR